MSDEKHTDDSPVQPIPDKEIENAAKAAEAAALSATPTHQMKGLLA